MTRLDLLLASCLLIALPSTAGAQERAKIVVLLKATAGDSTVTTFGSTGADGGGAGRAIADELRAAGLEVVTAAGVQAPVSGEGGDGGLPLDDRAALELARGVSASGAVVVGVDAAVEGSIRGTRLSGAAARASVRVLDVAGGSVVDDSSAKGAGWGDDAGSALGSAAVEATERAMRKVSRSIAKRWTQPRSAAAGTVVKIRGGSDWASIAAIIDKVAATQGVSAVHLAVEPRKVDLYLDTALPLAELAAQIKRARLLRGSVATRVKDGEVQVKVSGDLAPSGPQVVPLP